VGWLPERGGEFRIQLEIGACADIQRLLNEAQHRQMLDLAFQM
jgi:hypothetical protein